jgi:hypothetical protein
MQNNHPLCEDIEPPSTGSRRSDIKGYRSSRSPVAHDSIHGRNLIFKTYRFKKNRLEAVHSLSSIFAPFFCRSAEIGGQFGERIGLFDEDDEYPPSASRGIRPDSSRLPWHVELQASPAGGISMPSFKWDTPHHKDVLDISGCWKSSVPGQPRDAGFCPFAAHLRRPSFVSWFRCVPSGRLAPPGITARLYH